MSIISTSALSSPINNIKNFAYSILKTLKDSIVKGKKISNLSNCSECRKEIILFPLKAFTILSCGYVFHRLCIEKNFYLQFQICLFSGYSKKVKIIETGHRSSSESKEDMSDVDNNKDGEANHPTDQSIISLKKESCKRPSKDIPENKLSSKKVKTKDRNVSMLKKLIEELKSPSFSTSSTTSQAESITSLSNFFDLYSAIVKTKERIESVN
ncbi:1310_t:CDS:2 [Cetraspora pellucida]|uniref:1310_t:CDS:1 n=1 Tax=Cetraspora pellucida TaxID=1433469 RepID=A0A9N9P5N0_9GLOM|nr:1310_t:CDS:2 [Cetraspora pellucida]